MNACLRRLLCSAALAWPALVLAHASSQAYLELRSDGPETTQLRVDLALRDLDAALDLDQNADGQLSWGEVKAAQPGIERYVLAGLALQGCPAGFSVRHLELASHPDGTYASLQLQAPCPLQAGALLRYTLLGEIDPTHRALLKTTRDGQAATLGLLHPLRPAAWLDPAAAAVVPHETLESAAERRAAPSRPYDDASGSTPRSASLPRGVDQAGARSAPPDWTGGSTSVTPQFWREGMVHLLTGYDHLTFLLCLLLPAVLQRRQGRQHQPVSTAREALWPVLGIVTAFTVSHSITLSLAVLGWMRISPAVIEPLIAASIVLAALDNLRPFLRRWLGLPAWGVAGAFGLIHGFGFAGALAELELPAQTLAWALLQFNLGLEVAQIGVVLLAGTLLMRLRHWPAYPRWVLGLGSLCSAGLGGFWMVQRLA